MPSGKDATTAPLPSKSSTKSVSAIALAVPAKASRAAALFSALAASILGELASGLTLRSMLWELSLKSLATTRRVIPNSPLINSPNPSPMPCQATKNTPTEVTMILTLRTAMLLNITEKCIGSPQIRYVFSRNTSST